MANIGPITIPIIGQSLIMVILDMLVWYSMITGIIGIITVKIMLGMVIVIVRYEYRDNRHNNNWNHGDNGHDNNNGHDSRA